MKRIFTLLSFLAIIGFIISCNSKNHEAIYSLRKIKFNDGWIFQLGENNLASQADFDDSNWEAIQIPHDWSIEGEIDKNNPSGSQGGFYPCGVGYYRKTFQFENNWKDKLVLVTFDGVMSNSEVWINGQHLGKRPNGYVGFTYDLTHYLKNGSNILAVRADNLLHFKISGPAKNIGVDNGDPLDLASTKINQRKAFSGKCLLILQSKKEEGKITVEASSEGLMTSKIDLTTITK